MNPSYKVKDFVIICIFNKKGDLARVEMSCGSPSVTHEMRF